MVRRNHTFRDWVELHSGHAESKLLRIHVENLASLHDATDGEMKLTEMTRLYMRELGLRDALYEPLHAGLLARLYEQLEEDLAEEPGDDEGERAEPADAIAEGNSKGRSSVA